MIPPKNEPSSTRAHQPSLAFLQQPGDRCVMCKMMQSQSSLKKIQQRLPDIDEAGYESIIVKAKLKDVQSLASGLSWALLEVDFEIPSRAFAFCDIFSIETCDSGCKLTLLVVILDIVKNLRNSSWRWPSDMESFYHVNSR
jgi:hypothetical protein